MSLVWPARVAPHPTRLGRVGRLAHYASLPAAAYLLWLLYDNTDGLPSNLRIDHTTASLLFLLAIAVLLMGRAARWVLAAE